MVGRSVASRCLRGFVQALSMRDRISGPTWRGLETLEPRLLLSVSGMGFDPSASSWLGGSGTNDAVRGAVIQSDGTVVLAANISDALPGGLTPTILGSATANSSGSIVRLSSDGTQVLSVTRLANMVLDLSSDDAGNLYVAMAGEGFAKLNPDADQLLWSKDTTTLSMSNVQRVDAASGGTVAVLGGGGIDAVTSLGGDMRVFDSAGNQLGGFTTGRWTNDIALHEDSQTLIHLGFKNAFDSASGLPVQISYYEGRDYNGVVKYTGYDWVGDENSDRYLNSPTNNMADTRGYRATIGDDGYLYLFFESAGGNNLFRYDPFDIDTPVSLSGGDSFHSPFNTGANHISFFGKYEPETGAFVDGNHFLTRLSGGEGNTVGVRNGAIHADSEGRVYIAGSTAWGLPLPTHPAYSSAQTGFNPGVNNNYLGGSYLMIMESDLTVREYTFRPTGGITRTIAVRELGGDARQIVIGGSSNNQLYLVDPVQGTAGPGNTGWFSVIADSAGDPFNSAPVAQFESTVIENLGGGQVLLELDASLSFDADDDSLTYTWVFSDGTQQSGQTIEHTFNLLANASLTLVVTDGRGGWSTTTQVVGPPNASYSISNLAGVAPLDLTFDASSTTTPSGDTSGLTYEWDFGDGQTAEGMIVNHRFDRGGVFKVRLTVSDDFGGVSTYEEIIGVAQRDGVSVRLDLNSNANYIQPGYIPLTLANALYSPETGFGWREIGPDFASGSNRNSVSWYGRDLYNDWHQFSKYPGGPDQAGVFLVDLPDGEYQVLLRLSHNDNPTYPGILANGERVVSNANTLNNGRRVYDFKVNVTDGQLELTFMPPYWVISGIEVFDTGPANQPDATGSFRADPVSGESPLLVRFTATGFDDTGLNYAWDFGDGQFGSGAVVDHLYDEPGDYVVSLTVSGGSSDTIVSFGGDMISNNQSLPGLLRLSGVDASGNGFDDDSVRAAPFGTTPGGFLANAGNNVPSGRVYGGIESIAIDALTMGGFPTHQFTNSGAEDYINIRDQRPSGAAELQHRAAFLFIKEDFLAGAHAQRVYFDVDSELTVTYLRWENTGVGRWLIKDGDQYFVSEATFSGIATHSINPADTDWAPYSPRTDVFGGMDFDQDSAVFEPRVFNDIRALGVLTEQDGLVGGNGRIWYHFAGFTATALTAPVSTTVTVVAPTPRVDIEVIESVAKEKDLSPAIFQFNRTGPNDDPLTAFFQIGGTAGFSDFTLSSPDGILGDGWINFLPGNSTAQLVVTPIADDFREPTETVTLTLTESGNYHIEPPDNPTLTVFIEDYSLPFIDWGGDYVSSNQTLRGGTNPTVTVGDYSGNELEDDSRVSYAFSLDTPMSPNVGPSYDGDNPTFYGGAIGTVLGSTSAAFQTRAVTNNADQDRVSLRMQPSGADDAELHTIWLWPEDDFLLEGSPMRLGGNRRIELNINRWERMAEGRWVLGDGDLLHVSEQTFSGSGLKAWEGQSLADSMWAVFTPEADNINFDAASAIFDIPIDAIDVRMAGFLSDKDFNGDAGRHWLEFNRFRIEEGDNRGPEVVEVVRDGGVGRPDELNTISIEFSKDVIDSIQLQSMTIWNQTLDEAADLSGSSFSYDQSTWTATWDLTSLALVPAFYTITLDDQMVFDGIGNLMDGNGDGRNGGDFVQPDVLVALPGDANLDGVVDDADLAIVQANLGMSGAGFTDGDFTGDGRVGLRDSFLLLEHHGQSVVPPEPAALMVGLGDADDGQASSPPALLAASSDEPGSHGSQAVQATSSPILLPVLSEESNSATSLTGTGDWASDPIPGPIPDNAGALSPVPVFARGAAGEVPGPNAGMPGALAGLLTSRPSGGVLASTPAGGLLGLWDDGEDDEDGLAD
ncbi:MAG: PKD domain-containing protein [Phycisphaeraceae bacterium]|nr:PKD domain-containing protein [Phycisphaeraceae bacterium]